MLGLRSQENTDPAYVRFENKTGRSVDVVWISYSGKFVRFGTLQPGEFLDVNTFKTHPWVFIDRRTGEKMKVGPGTIFYPLSCTEIKRILGLNARGDLRVTIPVTLPLFTLRQISLQAVLNCLNGMDGIESLELPPNLIGEIQWLNKNKENIIAMYDFP